MAAVSSSMRRSLIQLSRQRRNEKLDCFADAIAESKLRSMLPDTAAYGLEARATGRQRSGSIKYAKRTQLYTTQALARPTIGWKRPLRRMRAFLAATGTSSVIIGNFPSRSFCRSTRSSLRPAASERFPDSTRSGRTDSAGAGTSTRRLAPLHENTHLAQQFGKTFETRGGNGYPSPSSSKTVSRRIHA